MESTGLEFVLVIIIRVALAFGGFKIMESKGRSGVAGAMLCVFLGIIGILICLVLPRQPKW